MGEVTFHRVILGYLERLPNAMKSDRRRRQAAIALHLQPAFVARHDSHFVACCWVTGTSS